MTMNIRNITALACDDVRFEKDDKPILIGVLTSRLEVPDFPSKFKLWFVPIIDVVAAGQQDIQYRVLNGSGVELLRAEGTFEGQAPSSGVPVPFGPVSFTLSEAGPFTLQYLEGSEWRPLQEWDVRLAVAG